MADPPADWPFPLGAWQDRYDVTVHRCDACAARDRKAWAESQGRGAGRPPPMGEYYAVTLEE